MFNDRFGFGKQSQRRYRQSSQIERSRREFGEGYSREQINQQSTDLYGRQQAITKRERQLQAKIEQTKEREKTFYREQIETLEKKIEQLEIVIQSEKEKNSPERQNLIHSLNNQIVTLKHTQDLQIQKLTALIEKRNKQIKIISEQYEAKDKSNFQIISDLTNQVKALEQKLFNFENEKEMEIKVIQTEMSQIRQKEADDLKKQFQKMKSQFDLERQQWKKIVLQTQDGGSLQKKEYEQQKAKFLEEKKRLKTKIAELKMRLKEKQEQKGNGETQLLIKSLKEMNNNQAHFSSYEDAITFMDRQVRKATMKIQQKNREINNLLEQLKTMQSQTQNEINEVKQKSKADQKKLYDKLFTLQEEVDELQQKLRQKERYIKKKEIDLDDEKEGHKIQVQNLKKIIEQMERDYKRVTGNKKTVEDSYRQERQNVISGKLDINQEKKKKWNDLIRQRNQLQIVYRQRQMQLKGNYQTQIDKLKREKQRLIEEKQEFRADAELLRERLNESNEQNKQNKMADYQKKLATLDLQIALTQNLFSTLSNATSNKKSDKIRSELQEMSEKRSSKVDSQHSFELKGSDIMTPLFVSHDIPKEDVYKGGLFSFTPFGSNK